MAPFKDMFPYSKVPPNLRPVVWVEQDVIPLPAVAQLEAIVLQTRGGGPHTGRLGVEDEHSSCNACPSLKENCLANITVRKPPQIFLLCSGRPGNYVPYLLNIHRQASTLEELLPQLTHCFVVQLLSGDVGRKLGVCAGVQQARDEGAARVGAGQLKHMECGSLLEQQGRGGGSKEGWRSVCRRPLEISWTWCNDTSFLGSNSTLKALQLASH